MKILFICECGEGLPLALRSQHKKCEVKLWNKKETPIGEGLVEEVKGDAWMDAAKHSDIVVITSPNLTGYKELTSRWTPTIGGNRLEYQLARDPELWKTFYKLGGGVLTTPPPDSEELIIGAWYGRGGWRLPAVYGHVDKGFLEGGKGLGVNGVGVCVTSDVGRDLYAMLLKPLSQTLKREEYLGFVSMVAAFDGGNFYPIKIQAGVDSVLIPALVEITDTPLPTIFKSVIKDYSVFSYVKPIYGMAVMISIPPYPYVDVKVLRAEVDGVNEHNLKHLFLVDINKQNGKYRCAGVSGALGYVTARGNHMMEARKRVYRTIDNLNVPHLQYRRDIGKGFNKFVGRVNTSFNS